LARLQARRDQHHPKQVVVAGGAVGVAGINERRAPLEGWVLTPGGPPQMIDVDPIVSGACNDFVRFDLRVPLASQDGGRVAVIASSEPHPTHAPTSASAMSRQRISFRLGPPSMPWANLTYRHKLVGMTAADTPHPSDSSAQADAEWWILHALGKTIDVALDQHVDVAIGDAIVKPDGVAMDHSVFVEVFAHIGKLKSGQRHKVSTDALKLIAIREVYPKARLILAFADQDAAGSVTGWKAETLKANGIEIRVVDLDPTERAKVEAAQARQTMVNPS
jgi:hypothetical protein